MSIIDTIILDNIIIGRVEPQIYAFSTQTVPCYLKIGDTYRTIEQRLDEWRRHFPNLVKEYSTEAKVDNDTFFRDYAVHKFLEDNGFPRLQPGEIESLDYYSREFFKNVSTKNIEDAINNINNDYANNLGKYQYYKLDENKFPLSFSFKRGTDNYPLRDNQKQTVDNFLKAINSGRKNLLMYAVMRFGKSFTSMNCALQMSAKFVVIVSAKADVKIEWQNTIESHKNFIDYEFADSEKLDRNSHLISETLKSGKHLALFLTLQDLQGDTKKPKHKELFESTIDLLIVDETHFGARAAEYGRVLTHSGLSKKDREIELNQDNRDADIITLSESTKILRTKVRLHLSGTPYRILMGDEFEKDDIVAFYQFTDIIKDKEKWDADHLNKDNVMEWDNPYYGFPQMVRFAFNPPENVRKKLEKFKKAGGRFALSELFRPKSIIKNDKDNSHRQFKLEAEVLDLLYVIDGVKNDNNLLGFLDYDKIKDGQMCRHIVCVLPYCASCDALEFLLKTNSSSFKNLSDYEIINISGVDSQQYPNTLDVKNKIEECELSNKKSITLTVNRMLTGSTVKEWDTMIYLKDTSSPQEYDQAIFRIQNQYIKTYKTNNGDTIKYNMKPQTLLVDFDPNRMFVMQELKSQIYNVNTEKNGNTKLAQRIKEELKISPIIVLNHKKMTQVTPNDILDVVREYSSSKSIMDEATEIPADYNLLNNAIIKSAILKLDPIDSKKGISIKPNKELNEKEEEWIIEDNLNGESKIGDIVVEDIDKNEGSEDYEKTLYKKISTYYAQILFFAFLTESKVKSLEDVINTAIETSENKRIFKNVGLDLSMLKYVQEHVNPFILSKLDYKIQNINSLMRDAQLSPIERANSALKKFDRFSDSEIITPESTAKNLIELLPNDVINCKILDIASKQAEFTIALYKRFGEVNRKNFYSLSTSPITYEITRKIYKILDIPVENVISNFYTYDLISTDNTQNIKYLENMKFKTIVGNPPYQKKGGSGGSNDAPIYQRFAKIATDLKPEYISLIIKAAWMSTGRENLLGNFRRHMMSSKHIQKMIVYSDSSTLFPGDVEIKGGICYYLENSKYVGDCDYTLYIGEEKISSKRKLDAFENIIIRDPRISKIVQKVECVRIANGEGTVDTMISADTPFGIPSNPKTSKKNPIQVFEKSTGNDNIFLYHIERNKRKVEFVSESVVKKNKQDIKKIKVLITGAGGSGNDKRIVGIPELAPANSVCSQSYLYAAFNSQEEAKNFNIYIYTKFFRILLSALKITQSAPKKTYRFIPIQNFTNSSDINWVDTTENIDKQLYKKYGLDDDASFIEKMIDYL